METKTAQVLAHLKTKGKITQWEAIQLFRATRLSAIIFNLKRRGYDIASIWTESGKTRFVTYIMKVGEDNV